MVALLGTFVGSAFALVRFALGQNKALTDRFVTYLETALCRQEEVNAGFKAAIDGLTANVRANSAVLQKVAERIGV